VQIRDALLTASVPTVAFVNKRAISAGALIGLSAQTLMMATGSTLGAAAPVVSGSPGAPAQPAQEKTVSYVRKEFRATAEARQRPLLLAEAMVDADVVVPGIVEKGKLLTLTTDEALLHKVADFRADTRADVLKQLGLEGAELRLARPGWTERLVGFLTLPMVSALLIGAGVLGLLIEIGTPGLGLAGGLGVSSLALVFWGHWLVQLAGWEELLLAGAGLALLAVEVLIIPGFGLAGVLGLFALVGAAILGMTGAGDTTAASLAVASRVISASLIALLAGLVLLRFLPRRRFARQLVLESALGSGPADGSAPESDGRWLGKQGLATSVLRPAGIADIDGQRLDVVSNGALIEAGSPVEVTQVDGNRIVVRQVAHKLSQDHEKE
jgi:membrane-bound serine protease (ClpP class)